MAESLEQHYRRLLGLDDPWIVEQVDLDLANQRVAICLATRRGLPMPCPQCAAPCGLYDQGPERAWRHLDTMQFETVLKARVPRVHCPQHGVKSVEVPWAGKHSRFTLLFEAFALRVLEASTTVKAAAALLGLDWHSLQQIMERAVQRGLQRRAQEDPVRRVGIDEKSFGSGQSYVSLMSDLEAGRVLEVVPERTTEAGHALWQRLAPEQRQSVEAVALDMWEPFLKATVAAAPQAEIVHDKFHVSKHLNEAVDEVRRSEHHQLCAEGQDYLTGTKYLWLRNPEHWSPGQQTLFAGLRHSGLKVAKAWQIKELFREFWCCRDAEEALAFFKRWYSWASRCRLEPIKKVARMLKTHLDHLLTYFTYPISNAMSEGFNSKIQSLKHAARGFRSFENFRIRILFFCGRLNLYPITH
jgi:transposase